MNAYSQKSASIQPRASPPKIGKHWQNFQCESAFWKRNSTFCCENAFVDSKTYQRAKLHFSVRRCVWELVALSNDGPKRCRGRFAWVSSTQIIHPPYLCFQWAKDLTQMRNAKVGLQVVKQSNGFDIGFKKQEGGVFELITDLDFWEQRVRLG